ncbi:MAG TPA: DNA/RNA non-specific endonuclease [Methylomusa anaerophila]|uniref:Nuclease n=1 Tax=Methylomusa anaerophila TaxID=1930071 RepID=A0A348ALQ5_9FIRM|nr:DNA/RNA non-specific endonuclease [Methylomusa anaerophila]BBB92003.1 nuclease precursor [Methylomusa anaerophila]HML87985.1 DNA/RNA non-specific endonuclease [Methylomusa anaerophila]
MSIVSFGNYPKINQDLVTAQQQNALKRYIERTAERERIANELQTKNSLEVDTPQRTAMRKTLINPRDGLAMERLIGESDLFPTSYLEAGLKASKPVCRIEIRDHIGRVLGHGTGFLVSPSLLLTNNHVLENVDAARFSLAQFNYEVDLNLMPRQVKSFRLEPDRFFITDLELDFTLVAVELNDADGTKLSEFGFLPLFTESGKALLGEYVSIIQHPSGAPKAVAIRENKINDVFDDFIHYTTDTMPGSSGSPVLNDEWVVLALHHSGVPDPNDSTKYIVNEGIRISSIMKYLAAQQQSLSADKRKLLENLIAGTSKQPAPTADSGPKPMLVEELSYEWYERSTGYQAKFLGDNYEVLLPQLRSDLEQDIAPLKAGGNVLNYTHFSIVMSKSRRLAYYTAVNIDGSQLINLNRDADKWYFDPRLDRKYQCGPELYENNDLDRGHLVRRLDPVWGEQAKEANEDTFHFTNCSPQHKNLNQKTWLDLENYILQNAGKYDLMVTVFTGPVFRSDDVLYRREFQIPAEFWKVVAIVKDNGELSATAYLQTQKNLIIDLEFAYGEYKTYQIPVLKIEDLTGLDFGDLRQHDPLERIEAVVGRIIESPEDIRL